MVEWSNGRDSREDASLPLQHLSLEPPFLSSGWGTLAGAM